MHKSESPPFYHLFDIPVLCLSTQGFWFIFQVCNKLTSALCCITNSTHYKHIKAAFSSLLYLCLSVDDKKEGISHPRIIIGVKTLFRSCPRVWSLVNI